jgi:hypothetical protein
LPARSKPRIFGIAPRNTRKAFRALVEEEKLIPPQGQDRPYRVAADQPASKK